jgi:aminodeoxychorismate lyase
MTMQVFLNGQFVPEERAVVSVFDRGFLYGDGLFEGIRVSNGAPLRWAQHLARLQRGAAFLKIKIPFTPSELQNFAAQLLAQNNLRDAMLRVTLTRGIGARGYSPKGAEQPTVVMSLHPAPVVEPQKPPRWKLITATARVSANDPLTQFKTCNKLSHVLARAEADAAQADEALLLNSTGNIAEATSANVFCIKSGVVCTPGVAEGALPGITRGDVLEVCRKLGAPVAEEKISPAQLLAADGAFLTLSSWGIVEIAAVDGRELKSSPLLETLRAGFAKLPPG